MHAVVDSRKLPGGLCEWRANWPGSLKRLKLYFPDSRLEFLHVQGFLSVARLRMSYVGGRQKSCRVEHSCFSIGRPMPANDFMLLIPCTGHQRRNPGHQGSAAIWFPSVWQDHPRRTNGRNVVAFRSDKAAEEFSKVENGIMAGVKSSVAEYIACTRSGANCMSVVVLGSWLHAKAVDNRTATT